MPNSVDLDKISEFVEEWWDKSVMPSLCEFVEIPALSPSFDSDWEANGYEDAANNTPKAWTRRMPLKGRGLAVQKKKNRSPLLLVKIDGDADGEVLFYSHLDKQPTIFYNWFPRAFSFRPTTCFRLFI
jgi:acetylornithine deacetylase/succinyl-diaminopimelate desuccinylase-like protein